MCVCVCVLYIYICITHNAAAAAAAAATKSLQSYPTLCNPIDSSPPGSPVHGIFPGKSTGVGCHCLLRYHTQWNIIQQ